jgi:hypothetical protein
MLRRAAVPLAVLAFVALGTTGALARCPGGLTQMPDGTCAMLIFPNLACPPQSTYIDGKCKCGLPFFMINGKCAIPASALPCPVGKHKVNGICMTDLH